MKKLLARLGAITILGLFAVSCATSPKGYHVELTDRPEEVAQQDRMDVYEEFPYIDYRVTR